MVGGQVRNDPVERWREGNRERHVRSDPVERWREGNRERHVRSDPVERWREACWGKTGHYCMTVTTLIVRQSETGSNKIRNETPFSGVTQG